MTHRRALAALACAAMACASAGPAAAQAAAAAASTQWDDVWRMLVSGLRTDTSQRSTSGEQAATAFRSAGEAAASAIEAQRVAAEVARARSRHAYDTGQGYKACMVAAGAAGIGRAAARRDTYARSLAARDDAWFSGGGDSRAALSALLKLRQTVYCSAAERSALGAWCDAALGLSRGGGYAAGNSDAGVFALNRSYGAEEAMTGLDYVDTAAPLPTVPSPAETAGEAGGRRVRAIHAGLFVAAARTSLARVVLDGLQDTTAPSPSAGATP